MAQGVFQKSTGGKMEPPQNMRHFILLLIGQSVSLIGSGMTCFAQSIYAYTDLGGTITNLAILAALTYLPGIVASPIAGLIADRWNRRWVMFICNSAAAIATLVLRSLVVGGSIQIWHMYVLVIIISTANHFQWPAYFATIPTMVPFRKLGRVNGMVQVGRTLGQIGAPALAAWLVVTVKLQGIILFDMTSYLFAAVILLYVYIPPTVKIIEKQAGQSSSLLRDIFYGWEYLIARPGLIGLLALFAAANFVFAGTKVLIMPLALSITSVEVYGIVATVGAIASLAGGMIIGVWGGPSRRIYGIFGGLVIGGVGLSLMGLQSSLLFLFAGYALISFAAPFIDACGGIIWQSKVPVGVQGRVMAASIMVSTVSLQLGYLISGPLADKVFVTMFLPGSYLAEHLGKMMGTGKSAGLGFMLMIMGIVQILFVLGGSLYPRLRNIDDELPDTLTDFTEKEIEKQTGETVWRQIDLTRI